MNPLIQELTQEQLRTDIPAFRPGDTVRVHAKVVEGTRERIQLFEGVVIKRRGAGSAKLTQYVKFQMVLVWNVHSHYTHHVLLKLKWFATVKYVVQNFTTYAHYTEKQLVSKKSEDKHGKLPWKSEICEKSLYIKGFFFFHYHSFKPQLAILDHFSFIFH